MTDRRNAAPARAGSPWWTLLLAVFWIVGAMAGGYGLMWMATDDPELPVAAWQITVLSLLLVPALLDGNAAASLRHGMTNRWAIGLALVVVPLATGVLMLGGVGDLTDNVPTRMDTIREFMRAPFRSLLALLVMAPVAEELFFRGWLWERLRSRWSEPVVGLVTGCLFAAAHHYAAPLILPAAAALTLVRTHCGGLRASMLLHFGMNLMWALTN